MSTPDDGAVAAGHSVDPASWRVLFDELMFLVAGRFGRVEPRRTAREFVLGLLAPLERKNCWWLAEQAGHRGPQAMQRLLRTAVWNPDAVRDDVRAFVAAQMPTSSTARYLCSATLNSHSMSGSCQATSEAKASSIKRNRASASAWLHLGLYVWVSLDPFRALDGSWLIVLAR